MIKRSNLEAFFRRYGNIRARLPKSKGSLYEVYVFTEMCRQAKRAGFDVRLVHHGPRYRVRASPGRIGGPFGHAVLNKHGIPRFEIHNCIEVGGHSGMHHEADILLIDAQTQTQNLQPRVLVECKMYSSAARLKPEVRKAVGAALDLSESAHRSRITGGLQGCFHCGCGFAAFFVTNIRRHLRPDIETYLSTYEIYPGFGVRGGRAGSQFRHALRSYFANV